MLTVEERIAHTKIRIEKINFSDPQKSKNLRVVCGYCGTDFPTIGAYKPISVDCPGCTNEIYISQSAINGRG